MSSGVAVNDAVCKLVNDVKVMKGLLYVIIKINEDKTELIVDDKRCLSDCGEQSPKEQFEDFSTKLQGLTARFAVYHIKYGGDSKLSKVIFIAWVNEDVARVNEKMLYASSRNGLLMKLSGLYSKPFQCNDATDLDYETIVKSLPTI